MPSLEWNRRTWDREYLWDQRGDEWSSAWGSPDNQWSWTLQPRLRKFLPARRVLEIGPGHGRWSAFLLHACQELVLVDVSQSCIDACKARFGSSDRISYLVNDGTSLTGVEATSIDLVFSFDSLVHAEIDVLDAYLKEIAGKLSADGAVFLHHSNLGQFRYFRLLRKIEAIFRPPRSIFETHDESADAPRKPGLAKKLIGVIGGVLMALRIMDRTHMRALSVSAARLRQVAEKHGYSCISQEVITWGRSRRPIDCISVIVRKGSALDNEQCANLVNRDFMREARYVGSLASLYVAPPSKPAAVRPRP